MSSKTKKRRRRREPKLVRRRPNREERPIILIVCEGKNTEPSYFRQFKLSSARIKPVGEGYNTDSLVERAEHLRQHGSYDQVWCVFDADPKPDNRIHGANFNRAVELCKRYKFGIAYSNQAFEYWLLLHFENHQGGAMNRKDYAAKLNRYLGPFGASFAGKKSKMITPAIFRVLCGIDSQTGKSRTSLAIDRARRIYQKFDHHSPALEESSTTVFRLVEELLKYA